MADDWRRSLRHLSRRAPSKNIEQTILDTMRSDAPDRVAAIIAAAFVDLSLAMGIIRVLKPSQDGINILFWSPDGPFASFERRIAGVKAIGIVGNKTLKNLEVIKDIRNPFAHSLADIDFSTTEITDACRRLVLSDNAKFFVDQEQKRKVRYMYCHACDTIFRAFFNDFATASLTGNLKTSRVTPILP